MLDFQPFNTFTLCKSETLRVYVPTHTHGHTHTSVGRSGRPRNRPNFRRKLPLTHGLPPLRPCTVLCVRLSLVRETACDVWACVAWAYMRPMVCAHDNVRVHPVVPMYVPVCPPAIMHAHNAPTYTHERPQYAPMHARVCPCAISCTPKCAIDNPASWTHA